jgi:hypothetical protein
VVIPGVYDGRGKMFFFVNFEATHSPSTITTNSTLMLPDAQNGIFKYNGGPPAASTSTPWRRRTASPRRRIRIVAKLLGDIRLLRRRRRAL